MQSGRDIMNAVRFGITKIGWRRERMESLAAVWLDTVFRAFDYAILSSVHALQQSGADLIFGPISELFALLGKGGIALVLLGVGLSCFRKTRKYGIGVILSILFGALVTNAVLKPLVARARPYADGAGVLHQWWLEAGAAKERDLSFPSGHMTAATAAMSAIFWLGNKRYSWTALLFALVMGFSRLYLVVHYPTDVIAGAIVGFLAGALAAYLVRRIYKVKTIGEYECEHMNDF